MLLKKIPLEVEGVTKVRETLGSTLFSITDNTYSAVIYREKIFSLRRDCSISSELLLSSHKNSHNDRYK